MRRSAGSVGLLIILSACGNTNDVDRQAASAAGPSGQAITLDFYHCAVRPFRFDGQWWEVQDAYFDAGSKPENLSGTGAVVRDGDGLRYTDLAGDVLTFRVIPEEATNRCA